MWLSSNKNNVFMVKVARMLKKYTYLLICLTVIIKFFSGIAIADPSEFTAGEHYKILKSAGLSMLPSATVGSINDSVAKVSKKPQVLMFFNYACYGCWLVNKDFISWKNANNGKVGVYYYPVAFNNIWENMAKCYYVNKELWPDDDGEEMFLGIHRDHKKLWIESEMINFYAQKEITKDRFLQKYQSFDVERKVKKSIEIAKMYEIHITPSIVINGEKNSYMVNFTMVKDPEMLFKVMDYLIKENP